MRPGLREAGMDAKLTSRGKAKGEPVVARFRLLVCIDGSDASSQALRYAVRIGSGTDADLTLLYVRPVDQGLRSGGLQASVARQNLLDWGLELPGTRALRQARKTLIEIGYMDDDWDAEVRHSEVHFDPVGDHTFIYRNRDGRRVVLKLLVSPSVARGVLDQCDMDQPDLTILAPSRSPGLGVAHVDTSAAETVAIEHNGSVLIAREIEESHGHLICVWKNAQSIRAARRDAEIAARCDCPVYLYSVAATKAELPEAQEAVDDAERAILEIGAPVFGKKVDLGDPVERIVAEGRQYSVIVMSSRSTTGLRRFFTTGTSFRVLQRAQNSVMIAR